MGEFVFSYNLLNRYYRQQQKTFERNLSKIDNPQKTEAIHDLRVSLKKTYGLFLFLEFIDPKKIDAIETFKPFKKIFRKVRKIRDYQVQQILVKHYNKLLNNKTGLFLSFFQNRENKERKKMENWLPNYTPPDWDYTGKRIQEFYHRYKRKELIILARTYVLNKLQEVPPLLKAKDNQ